MSHLVAGLVRLRENGVSMGRVAVDLYQRGQKVVVSGYELLNNADFLRPGAYQLA